jgi:hypothetical protein
MKGKDHRLVCRGQFVKILIFVGMPGRRLQTARSTTLTTRMLTSGPYPRKGSQERASQGSAHHRRAALP